MFNSKKHPRERFSYAVTTGIFAGEILIFVEDADKAYSFLSIPKMENRSIPQENFDAGIQSHIVDVVGQIPRDVFKVCRMQYKKNKRLIK